MKRLMYAAFITLLALGLSLPACSQSVVPPTSAEATTAPAPTTAKPTAAPTKTAAAPAEKQPQYGGVFRFGTPAGSTGLVPIQQRYDGRFMKAIYDTLLRLDENGELQPWLATTWKLSSNNTTLTLTIRKGVKFHDGADLNAEAVKWNILQRQAAKLGDYATMTSVDVLDDYTVKLNFSSFQNTLFGSLWYMGAMPTSPTTYQKLGEAQARWNPSGTGPFKFVSYNKDALLKLERFDGYWQPGKPYLDGYETVWIADHETLSMAFQRGEISTAQQLTAKAISELVAKGYPVMKETAVSTGGGIFIGDTANADSPWANEKVREAVLYAVDLEAIAKATGYGLAEPMIEAARSGSYAYVPGLGRKYDTAKAKALLKEAGYPNGFQTTLTLNTKDYNTWRQAWVGYLAEVGIDVKVNLVDMAGMYSNMQNGWRNGLVDKAIGGTDWLAQIDYQFGKDAPYIKSWTRPAGLLELLDKALRTADTKVRNATAREIVKLFDKGAYGFPQVATVTAYPLPKDGSVHNAEYIAPWGQNKLWSPADVWFSK